MIISVAILVGHIPEGVFPKAARIVSFCTYLGYMGSDGLNPEEKANLESSIRKRTIGPPMVIAEPPTNEGRVQVVGGTVILEKTSLGSCSDRTGLG